MKAVLFESPCQAKFLDMPRPQITNPTDVLVRVAVTGICASDIAAYRGLHPFRVLPVVSGHELSGVVAEVGSAVVGVRPGDRVAVEPHDACGTCAYCREGNYHVCPQRKSLGTQQWPGSFGEYVVVPQKTIIPVPDDVSFEQAALLEPLAVGVHATRIADIRPASTVAVIGAGMIGLAVVCAAKAAGAKRIFVSDVAQFNLERALRVGATDAINVQEENLAQSVLRATDGMGVDRVFITFGGKDSVDDALTICRRMGTVVEIAMFGERPAFTPFLLQTKEISFLGSNVYNRDDFITALKRLQAGEIHAEDFITATYSFAEALDAFDAVTKRAFPNVKAMIRYDA